MQNKVIITVFAVIAALSVVGISSSSSSVSVAYAQSEQTQCQTGALIGYFRTIFGLANVCTNGHRIDVDIATNYIPQPGKVFEAWLVDDYYGGSGYALSMGKISKSGTLGFDEDMTNALTYTDIVITLEPDNDLSPSAAWSDAVAQTWLLPPFGQ